ncbi:MAG: sn-glycerol-1-phosphate dehydrogenase [Clostridia bacterium]|nr:sn-glycerol-1-phosphate dehydrogenase [Clostridia bacterium]
MAGLAEFPLERLLDPKGHLCGCGKRHTTDLRTYLFGEGVLQQLPRVLQKENVRRPFVVCDEHTDMAAGGRVRQILADAGVSYASFCFQPQSEPLEPDEHTVGALCIAFDPDCDVIVAVGSGVINDCCKVLAHATGRPSMAIATAPSMDGYASDNASMIKNGVKVSLYGNCPVAILADADVLRTAPEKMLKAGMGDMLAKYVSLCEWRISHLVTGEYFCPEIAELMRAALSRVRSHADGLMARKTEALRFVMEGLVLSGVAMNFAQVSRPASGVEHYFSHIWDMKVLQGLAKHTLHGIQVGVGTCLTLRLYERIINLQPSRAKAETWIQAFSDEGWETHVKAIFGPAAAREVLSLEAGEKKNDPQNHARRLDKLLLHWNEILSIIREELPGAGEIHSLMEGMGMATTPREIGLTSQDAVDALIGSRDMRDKYLTSSLLWDLGELMDFAAYL